MAFIEWVDRVTAGETAAAEAPAAEKKPKKAAPKKKAADDTGDTPAKPKAKAKKSEPAAE